MKIQPGQSEPILPKPIKARAQEVKNEPQTTDATGDNFSPTQNNTMLQQLHNQPEVRPDALAKAKQLAADPNYPPADIIEKLAKMFVDEAK